MPAANGYYIVPAESTKWSYLVRHDRALPVAIHGMMPARAERGDGSEEKSP